jgi:phosphohistidine phosphatase
MRLYILRHGEAATPPGGGEKALTDSGIWQADQAAALLAGDLRPQLVLHSPKLRALQTMQRVVAAIPGTICEETSALLPEGNTRMVEELLATYRQATILLVSHLPLVAELVAWFTSGERGNYPLPGYSPAGLVALEMEPLAARGCGIISWHAFGPDYSRYDFKNGGTV